MKKVWRYTKAAFVIACLWLVPIIGGWISWVGIESWISWELLLSPGDWGWLGRIAYGLMTLGWTILIFVALMWEWGGESEQKRKEREIAEGILDRAGLTTQAQRDARNK